MIESDEELNLSQNLPIMTSATSPSVVLKPHASPPRTIKQDSFDSPSQGELSRALSTSLEDETNKLRESQKDSFAKTVEEAHAQRSLIRRKSRESENDDELLTTEFPNSSSVSSTQFPSSSSSFPQTSSFSFPQTSSSSFPQTSSFSFPQTSSSSFPQPVPADVSFSRRRAGRNLRFSNENHVIDRLDFSLPDSSTMPVVGSTGSFGSGASSGSNAELTSLLEDLTVEEEEGKSRPSIQFKSKRTRE